MTIKVTAKQLAKLNRARAKLVECWDGNELEELVQSQAFQQECSDCEDGIRRLISEIPYRLAKLDRAVNGLGRGKAERKQPPPLPAPADEALFWLWAEHGMYAEDAAEVLALSTREWVSSLHRVGAYRRWDRYHRWAPTREQRDALRPNTDAYPKRSHHQRMLIRYLTKKHDLDVVAVAELLQVDAGLVTRVLGRECLDKQTPRLDMFAWYEIKLAKMLRGEDEIKLVG